jgi:hypothetical protein
MHTSDKPLRHKELLEKLGKFNIQIKERNNKCMLFHPNINGAPAIYTIHVPHGDKKEHSRPVICAIRRRFNIQLEEFYKD